ncbi:MAG: YkgJ family cysteine cluster protein [Thermodesulfobacteriota bacterium]
MESDPRSPDFFECKQCGDCCNGYGGTFITEKDVAAIAGFIGEDPRGFIEKYCTLSGGKPVLAQGSNGYCIFWDRLCLIHPVKPRMCREWPFIESVLTDIRNWKIMGRMCPGISTDVQDHALRSYLTKLLIERNESSP